MTNIWPFGIGLRHVLAQYMHPYCGSAPGFVQYPTSTLNSYAIPPCLRLVIRATVHEAYIVPNAIPMVCRRSPLPLVMNVA